MLFISLLSTNLSLGTIVDWTKSLNFLENRTKHLKESPDFRQTNCSQATGQCFACVVASLRSGGTAELAGEHKRVAAESGGRCKKFEYMKLISQQFRWTVHSIYPTKAKITQNDCPQALNGCPVSFDKRHFLGQFKQKMTLAQNSNLAFAQRISASSAASLNLK